MNRRTFLSSAAALAATAVIGPALGKLALNDMSRLLAAINIGLVEDQVFYLSQPITIAWPSHTTFRRCTFIFDLAEEFDDSALLEARNMAHVYLDSCAMTLTDETRNRRTERALSRTASNTYFPPR